MSGVRPRLTSEFERRLLAAEAAGRPEAAGRRHFLQISALSFKTSPSDFTTVAEGRRMRSRDAAQRHSSRDGN